MKIIFFGSDIFAVASLEELVKSDEEVCLVVTQPDKKKGRGLILSFSAVKEFAIKSNLKIIQPDNLKDADFLKLLKDINPDLFITAAYGKIVPKEALEIPNIFPINIHASLLPKYRGAAPINWAMVNAEKETGITIIKMNEFMDGGEIISREALEIKADDTAISLREKLSLLAAQLLIKTINSIRSDSFALTPQKESDATFAPKLNKSDGLINWNEKASNIHHKVRGLFPWPGSFTYFRGKILKVHQAEFLPLKDTAFSPGEIIQILPDAIVVAAANGGIKIKLMQIESGKKISAQEFVSGYRIRAGDKLG